MGKRPRHPHAQRGFTLIELSIVLVIIALLAASILVGQDLIRTAGVRASISQLGKYNTAVNTFRGKYGYLPGDIPYNQASSFGLFAFDNTCGTGAGTASCGDGNGYVDWQLGLGFPHPIGESLAFWRHLSEANMVDGSFAINGECQLQPSGIPVESTTYPGYVVTPGLCMPKSKGGNNVYIMAFHDSSGFTFLNRSANYLTLTPIQYIQYSPGGTIITDTGYGMTPVDAFAIDTKLDDGRPYTGRMRAVRGSGNIVLGDLTWNPAQPYMCLTGAAGQEMYATGTDTGNLSACSLVMEIQ